MVRATRPRCSYQYHESSRFALVAAMVAVSTAASARTAASYNSNNALAFGTVGGGPASGGLGCASRGSLVARHRVQVRGWVIRRGGSHACVFLTEGPSEKNMFFDCCCCFGV